MRLDTILAASGFHALSEDSLHAAAQEKAFFPVEGQDAAQPDAEFIFAFGKCLSYAINVASPVNPPENVPCPKCNELNMHAARFCTVCGSPMSTHRHSSAREIPASPDAATAGALQAIAHHLTEQTKLLQQMQLGASEADDMYEDQELDAKATCIWNEKLLSVQEITQIQQQHSYPMASYCQRAMVIMVEVYQKLYAYGDKEILLLISKAVRDMLMEHLLPGSKPQQAEKLALASSLIGHRMSKEELRKAITKPQNPWNQRQQPKQEPPPPSGTLAKPKYTPPKSTQGQQKSTQGQQTDL